MRFRKLRIAWSVGWGIACVLLIVGVIVVLPSVQSTRWVGHTDLMVTSAVTDARSAQPVRKAIVHVRVETGEPGKFPNETAASEFAINTDDGGCATQLCKNCICFGSKGLREDTFVVYLPRWWYHVTGEGYAASSPEFLELPKNAQLVQRGDPATVRIPVALSKSGT